MIEEIANEAEPGYARK